MCSGWNLTFYNKTSTFNRFHFSKSNNTKHIIWKLLAKHIQFDINANFGMHKNNEKTVFYLNNNINFKQFNFTTVKY